MLDKSSAYDVLAEEMYFWTKVALRISTFWTLHYLSGVVQIPHGFLKPGASFSINFAPFCNILAKT